MEKNSWILQILSKSIRVLSILIILGFAFKLNGQSVSKHLSISTNIGASCSITKPDNSQKFTYPNRIGDFLAFNLLYHIKGNIGVLLGFNIQGYVIDEREFERNLMNNFPNFITIELSGYNPNEYVSISAGLFREIHTNIFSFIFSSQIGYQVHNINPYTYTAFLKKLNFNNYIYLSYKDVKLQNKISFIESIETQIRLTKKFGISIKTDLLLYTPKYDCKLILNELQKGITSQQLLDQKISINSFSFGLGIYKNF